MPPTSFAIVDTWDSHNTHEVFWSAMRLHRGSRGYFTILTNSWHLLDIYPNYKSEFIDLRFKHYYFFPLYCRMRKAPRESEMTSSDLGGENGKISQWRRSICISLGDICALKSTWGSIWVLVRWYDKWINSKSLQLYDLCYWLEQDEITHCLLWNFPSNLR